MEYRSLRNRVSTLIDKAKRETYENKIKEGEDDPRTLWKLFRQFGTSKNMLQPIANLAFR